MIVKVFFPEKLFFRREETELYGDIIIEENSVSYYVITNNNDCAYRKLGSVIPVDRRCCQSNDSMCFVYDNDSPHIYLSYLNIKTKEQQICNIILYDASQICMIHSSTLDDEQNDINILKYILNSDIERRKPKCNTNFESMACRIWNVLHNSKVQVVVQKLFGRMALYNHFRDWKASLASQKQRSEKISKVVLDIVLGIIVMIFISNFTQNVEYLMQLSADAVLQLRALLRSLKGNPIGLKLNVQLNNFFLDCFTYHVDLWAVFIVIISPMVHHLFLPLAIFGLFGLSFQLAIICDLLFLVVLHAHCFYIYAALLYNIEKVGIAVMWKVVLGRRKNILKDRVVSHDYMNRQLYLTTMFFTTLVFLMPTILVYYIVFATLRICAYFINYFLLRLRRKILQIPVYSCIKWMLGTYYDLSNIELEVVDLSKRHSLNINSSVFKLHVRKSSPWTNKFMQSDHQFQFDTSATPKDFLIGIISGEMMSFT